MPYVYNPKTGKNDLWQPEELTTASGMSGQTTRTLNEPRTIDKVLGSLSRFGEDFLKGVTAPPSANRPTGLYGPGTKTNTSTQTGGNPPRMLEEYFKDQAEEQQIASGTYGLAEGETPTTVVDDIDKSPTAEDFGGVSSTGTSRVKTKDLNAQTLFDAENKLYNELRKYQEATATNTSEAQRRALEQSVKKSQLEFQQMRNAMMESGFTQDRALLQGAQQRGLGGSGLEQLGRTQQRIGLGQNLNQLSQQYGNQLQSFLNAELGIEQNLSEAMSKAALDETINVTTAMAKAMDNEWVAWQRAKTIEDSAKFDEKETASIYLEYVTALANAGEDAALKEQIRTSYKGLLPETLFNQGSNIAGNKALGDVARKASVRTSAASSGTEDQARFAAAMAQDEGDGRVSMLKTGSTTLYFPNDDSLILHVRSLYSGRENANRIQIAVKGGKVVYTTDQGQEFTTYNQASNSLG
jgi:hypothetical protein